MGVSDMAETDEKTSSEDFHTRDHFISSCATTLLTGVCDSDSVFISIIRIYTYITSTAFTMGGIVLRTIVDIG